MLNLNYQMPYQYCYLDKQHIKQLKKKYGRRYQRTYGESKKRVWYDGEVRTTQIKHAIIKKLLWETRFRCSYCGKRLTNSEKPIDHFIPNSSFPEYSFHPLNLVPSCGYCNSSLKGTTNPIERIHHKYSKIKFSIVHPIIDDVNNHFIYKDPDNTIFDLDHSSIEALETIRIFHWHNLESLLDRESVALLEDLKPISDVNLAQLINECATYQQKTR